MMQQRAKITGVVLAGGRARRMGGGDKGLMSFRGRPLIGYALDALSAVTDRIVINANRNLETYRKLGYRVVPDPTDSYDGPLAGILSAMGIADTPYLLTLPCDSPLVGGAQLMRLYRTLIAQDAEICAAHDGERLQPVFLALRSDLKTSLESYLTGGQRKIDAWLNRHRLALADFSDQPGIFRNVNTPHELAELEARHV